MFVGEKYSSGKNFAGEKFRQLSRISSILTDEFFPDKVFFVPMYVTTSLIYANYYGTHISAILVHHRRNNIDIEFLVLLFVGYYLVVLFVCGVVTVLRETQHGKMFICGS